MILIALNTFLATPACVTPDGPATIAAQTWGAYVLQAEGDANVVPTYQTRDDNDTVKAGAVSTRTGAFAGFTWYGESYTLVVNQPGQ